MKKEIKRWKEDGDGDHDGYPNSKSKFHRFFLYAKPVLSACSCAW